MKNALRGKQNSIYLFSHYLFNKYPYIPSEKIIADEFLKYFTLAPPITTDMLRNRFGSGINICEHDLRGEARGLYATYEGEKPYIFYDPKEAPPSFTILHELRHLIGINFEQGGYAHATERDCESFAAIESESCVNAYLKH